MSDRKKRKILPATFYRTAAGSEPVRTWLKSPLLEDRRVIGNRIARVLFSIYKGEMVLLHGFIKKTQQTPEADLGLAVKRRKEFDRGKESK